MNHSPSSAIGPVSPWWRHGMVWLVIGGPLVGVPATDGEIVVGQPGDHFLDGTARLLPLIIGTTAVDVPTHFPPSKLHPLSWFGPDEDAARSAYGYGGKRFLGPTDLIQLTLEIGVDIAEERAPFVVGGGHGTTQFS